MSKRLWVVMCRFSCGTWDICSFTGGQFSSTNFYNAHLMKQTAYHYLKDKCKAWHKKDFKVVELIPNQSALKALKKAKR